MHNSPVSRAARAFRQPRAPWVALTLLLAPLGACKDKPAKPAPPAVVSGAVPEGQLSSIALTREAVNRLGIETVAMDSADVAATRTVGGEVVVPPGRALMVTAPMAGTVSPLPGAGIPVGGERVSSGQSLLRLVPLPPDLARVQVDVSVAQARLQQAQLEADRVASLFKERLVSARDNDRAQADLASARAAYDLSTGQQRQARGGTRRDSSVLSALVIAAPDAGVVRMVSVGAGQAVAAGALLLEIVQLDRLWVRVPLYAGDIRLVQRSANATVFGLGGANSGPEIPAVPVAAPPSADPNAASVDLFYEVRGGALRPGERVSVRIPLASGTGRSLAVPLSAVVRDAQGGAWVYEQTDSLSFSRRRVDVARVVGGRAVLSSGPRIGSRIVTAGAAELFGTEFGTGK